VGADPHWVAELWAAAEGHPADHNVTAVLPPVRPARDAPPSPPEEESPATR
jgi:hypothetical protein